MQIPDFSNDVQEKIEQPVTWTRLAGHDPRKVLLESNESFTVHRTLVDLLDMPENHPDVVNTKVTMLEDPLVQEYIQGLSDWEKSIITNHANVEYLPNQLLLLHDWGLEPADDPMIQRACEAMLSHQDASSDQFLSYTLAFDRKTREKGPGWTSSPCDHNLITSLFLLLGFKDEERVAQGVSRMSDLLEQTSSGPGWKCVPDLLMHKRGPGKKDEPCPMAIIDALRGYWVLPKNNWPSGLIDAGKTLLACWTERGTNKPYMFGHGKKFRATRPPFFWYNIGTMLDAVSHYPELVDTEAFQELLAVSRLAFNADGMVIPASIYTNLKQFSFGQKKLPSPWTTLYLCRVFKRVTDHDPGIVDRVLELDGASFKGSKKAGVKNAD